MHPGTDKTAHTQQRSSTPTVHWTPGHIELEENELADIAAKEAATEAKSLATDAAQLTLRDAKSIIRKALIARWQRQ